MPPSICTIFNSPRCITSPTSRSDTTVISPAN
jgi:hypothetical protein